MIGASAHQFMPDNALAFRVIGADAVTGDFTSDPFPLHKLAAYWSTNEWGFAKKLRVIVGFEGTPNSALRFALEVDATEDFGSAVEVASVQLTDDMIGAKWFDLAFSTDDLAYADPNAKYVRLKCTGVGSDMAFLDFTGFLGEGEGFTLDDGDSTTTEVVVGTNAVATVAFSDPATADDEVLIDDGVNDPVTFTFGAGPGLVAPGASAAASATNLAAAINAAVAAGDLAVSVVDDEAGELTITVLAAFSGLGDAVVSDPVDDGAAITIGALAGGVAGITTQAMFEFQGLPYAMQIAEIAAFIESDSSDVFTTRVVDNRIVVTNTSAAAGDSDGSATEDGDAGDVLTITDFSIAADEVRFWSFIRND